MAKKTKYSIRQKKRGGITYLYISTTTMQVDPVTKEKKQKEIYVESLGKKGVDISMSEAKIVLMRYNEQGQALTKDIAFNLFLDEFIENYKSLVGRNIRPRTYEKFVSLSQHFKSIAYISLREIDRGIINKMKVRLCEDLATVTVNMVLVELRKVLKYAKFENRIMQIPEFEMVTLTVEEKEEAELRKIERLSKEQLEALINSTAGNTRFYICVMAFTGMRPFEMMELLWSDVNMKEGFIRIRSMNSRKPGRMVPITSQLREVFNVWQRTSTNVCPFKSRHSARNAVLRAGQRIDLSINVAPYTFRKTYASLLAETGISPLMLAKLMGHKKIETANKYYADISYKYLAPEIERLPKLDMVERAA